MRKRCRFDKTSVGHISLYLMWFVFVMSACGTHDNKEVNSSMMDTAAIYYCPMHPHIQQHQPGKCPIPECQGMDLIKQEKNGLLDAVLKPVNSAVLSTIKVIHPVEKEISLTVNATGYIDYDNRTSHNIASRLNGRIEKLYVKYNFQPVYKGDKIFDIYSPDLLTAQENLIFIIKNDSQATELIEAAKQKLELLGFTHEQTEELISTQKVMSRVSVFSKWSGHIHQMNVSGLDEGSSASMSSMPEPSVINNSNEVSGGLNGGTSALRIKEGMYVTRGQTIFNVVDPHEVVAMLQIRSEDIAKVANDGKVELIIDGAQKIKMTGKINFIEPFIKPGAKTLSVRVDLKNDEHKHKIGTFVTAGITGEAVEGLWVPASSVVDLGKQKIVWLKTGGHFEARIIETGEITKDWVEIYDGITKKDEIAEEAHYLSDSEGFIKMPTNGE